MDVAVTDETPYLSAIADAHAEYLVHTTGQPRAPSVEPGEDGLWCYVDQVMPEPA